MRNYLMTLFFFLVSVSPTTNSAQNSDKDTVQEQPKEEIEVIVDSLAIKKEKIIDKLETIKKLEQEKKRLEEKKRKKEEREMRKFLRDIERVDRKMNVH